MGKIKEQEFSIVRGFKTHEGSGKIVQNQQGEYFIEKKKYLLGFTVKKQVIPCRNYDDAEDSLNELQTLKNFW